MSNAHREVAATLAPGLRAGDLAGVTVEPAGGVESPTTTPIVLLALAAYGS